MIVPPRPLIPTLLIALFCTVQASARAPVKIPTRPECTRCRVELRPVAELGEADESGWLVAPYNLVTSDSRGRFYVWDGDAPQVWVFGPDGRFLTLLGRDGEGPGEFRAITIVAIGRADSIYVFDADLARLTVFAPDYQLARTVRLSFPPNLFDFVPADEHIVLNARIRFSEREALPIHVVAFDGDLVHSFGANDAYGPDTAYGGRRALSAGSSGTVWSAWLNRYGLEEWTTEGTLLRTIEREADWFRPYDVLDLHAESPPPPVTQAVTQIGDTLWVLVKVAGPNWRDVVKPIPGSGGRFFKVTDYDVYHNTIIEAIDLRAGRLVVSHRVPGSLTGFLPGRRVYGTGYDAGLNPVVRVWEFGIGR